MKHPRTSRTQHKNEKRNRKDSANSFNRSRGQRKSESSSRRGSAANGDHVYLYGLHTVRAAIQNPDRKILCLYTTDTGAKRLALDQKHTRQVNTEIATAQQLERFVGSEAVHQGVVAKCAPLDMLDASELFHLADKRLILALDQLTDPHNVGAILRSASAIGADAVITTSRNSAQETAVLAKSASGALDMIKLIELRNLSKGMEELNQMGFSTLGLDSEGPLVLEDTLAVLEPEKVVLVLGSESKGLRQKTRESCTALTRLDMPGPIKSLNVSNAATLSLYVVADHLRIRSR
ncbi:MAG: 23S rRNA (guanosine(2251)-2'-O)-methyltransferase RlmB [Rhizobiaceae bacterium]